MQGKLLFIYNAKSGNINGLLDLMHKTFSPFTYPCDLCAITYGVTSMHGQWKKYIESLPFEIEFIYKDELRIHYPTIQVQLPSVVFVMNNNFNELITSRDFKQIKTIDALIDFLNSALQTVTPNPPSKS